SSWLSAKRASCRHRTSSEARISARLSGSKPVPREACVLFNFHLRPCGLDLLLDFVRFFFCHAFLNGLARSVNERFGIRQAQSRHSAANLLNHSNLVRAHFL